MRLERSTRLGVADRAAQSQPVRDCQRLPSGWNPEEDADDRRWCTGGVGSAPLVDCPLTAAVAAVAARSGPRPRARDHTILCQGRSTVTSRAWAARGRRCGQSQMALAPDAPSPRADRLRERGRPRKPVVPGPKREPVWPATYTSFLFWRDSLAGRPGIGAGKAPQVATLFHVNISTSSTTINNVVRCRGLG